MTTQDDHLIEQLTNVVSGLGQTFAPFCEVVLHDLRDPSQTIVAIENNISGRSIGQPSTEMGLARIADPDFPEVVANYENTFSDGRTAKSTSIGIKGRNGHYIAAVCLNVDTSAFATINALLTSFLSPSTAAAVTETLDPGNAELIRKRIHAFAQTKGRPPHSLSVTQRRELSRDLKESGLLNIRKSVELIATELRVSRATIYADVK